MLNMWRSDSITLLLIPGQMVITTTVQDKWSTFKFRTAWGPQSERLLCGGVGLKEGWRDIPSCTLWDLLSTCCQHIVKNPSMQLFPLLLEAGWSLSQLCKGKRQGTPGQVASLSQGQHYGRFRLTNLFGLWEEGPGENMQTERSDGAAVLTLYYGKCYCIMCVFK